MSSRSSILIIDDDTTARRSWVRAMTSAGFSAQAFASVEEFVFHAPLSTAGCIIADMALTGMEGIDLKRLLEAAELDLPIIFVTAEDSEQARADACEAGAAAYFSKPVEPEALLHAIGSVFSQSRSTYAF